MKHHDRDLRGTAAAAAMAAALLAGCAAVGPDFKPPVASVPDAWHDTSATATAGQADADPRWWLRFDDPVLSALIDRATAGNLDLQIAVARIDQARASEGVAGAARYPQVSATASHTRQGSGDRLPAGGVSSSPPYSVTLDASWELDLFGKVRRSVEAAGAKTEAAVGNRDDALVSLQAEVADSYAQLRAAQASLRMTAQSVAQQTETVALTRERAAHGMASQLDVESAVAQLRSTEARQPQYEQQIAASSNALAVLLGLAPGALDAELNGPGSGAIPAAPPAVLVGVPAALARRRPDIRAAEAQLHAQTAQVGVAVAQLYPDISLSGLFGFGGASGGDLLRWGNRFFSFGPSISLPIFQGGKLTANVELSKAEQQEAALNYRKTVLGALQEVEDAMASLRTEQGRRQSLEAARRSDESALALALDRYRNGLSTFIDVLSAQQSLVQAQIALVQSTLAVTSDEVALYKALGGGWQADA